MAKYFMFHKPKGCITATVDPRHKTVFDYVKEDDKDGLFPVGRLDKDTEGLLFFTDDGMWCDALMHPKHHVEKTYFFYAIGQMTDEKKKKLEDGLSIDMGISITKPATFCLLSTGTLSEISDYLSEDENKRAKKHPNTPIFSATLTISEGKKHQVKRMIRCVGCYVVYLKRVAIGKVKLDESLKPGTYRPLTREELNNLSQ